MPAQLPADYAVERDDFQRVLDGIAAIQRATTEELGSLDWLVKTLRDVGLVPIPESEATYAGEEDYINASQQGLIQLPREFARWLMLAAEYRPASYLEVGTFNGATASIATAYLARINPALVAVTLDVFPAFVFFEEVRELIPLRYMVGETSFDLCEHGACDAVFIDGDHSFEWAWADYCNVGRNARLCALHDVNNAPYREMHLGGVCGVWELIKARESGPGIEFHEIFEHPKADIMGIGVRVRL